MTSRVSESREFRDALGRFATGVTIVTAVGNETTHGMTASAFVSVSLVPPLVLVSLHNSSRMSGILPAAGRYGVSVLSGSQRELSEHFSGRGSEPVDVRFEDRAGVPLVDGALAYFVVRVIDVHQAGDHTLYIGLVEYFEAREDEPLLFYAGRYRHLHSSGACPFCNTV